MANSGRAKSCTTCRQVKLACNARITAPEPCSRCQNSGLECRFDSGFKRIPVRKFSKEVVIELHNLRVPQRPSAAKRRASNGSRISQPSPRSSSSAGDQSDEPSPEISTAPSSAMQPWLQLQAQEQISPQQLGSVILHHKTILTLLVHFERYYVPHALFLRPVQSVTQLISQSPLLFWTIMLVAAHRFDDNDIYDRLIEPLEGILSKSVCTAVSSVETVHAFLIHCLWPTAKHKALLDPSFNYVNLATAAAMQMHCYRPLSEYNVARNWKAWVTYPNRAIDEATGDMTWLACFELSVRVGTFFGLPISFSNSQQLKSVRAARARAEAQLPKKSSALYDILELLCVGNAQLDDMDGCNTTFSLIQSFLLQLDVLKTQHSNYWTSELEVEFQAARLYLLAIFFTKAEPDNLGEQAQRAAYAATIHLEGLKAAIALVDAMTVISVTTIPDRLFLAGALSFFPQWYFGNLHFAATFLAKVLLTPGAADGAARSQAVSSMRDAHKIFQSFPLDRTLTRGAVHIEILVNIIRSNISSNDFSLSSFIINNRLGASLMLDLHFRCKQYRTRSAVGGKSAAVLDQKMMNDEVLATNLPKTTEEKIPASNSFVFNLQPAEAQQEADLWSSWDTYVGNFGTDAEHWSSFDSMLSEMENFQDDPGQHDQTMLQPVDPMLAFSVWK